MEYKWYDINDTLPEDGERCLVWYRGQAIILTYNDYYKCWDDDEGDDYYLDLTEAPEWTRLPEDPNKL